MPILGFINFRQPTTGNVAATVRFRKKSTFVNDLPLYGLISSSRESMAQLDQPRIINIPTNHESSKNFKKLSYTQRIMTAHNTSLTWKPLGI